MKFHINLLDGTRLGSRNDMLWQLVEVRNHIHFSATIKKHTKTYEIPRIQLVGLKFSLQEYHSWLRYYEMPYSAMDYPGHPHSQWLFFSSWRQYMTIDDDGDLVATYKDNHLKTATYYQTIWRIRPNPKYEPLRDIYEGINTYTPLKTGLWKVYWQHSGNLDIVRRVWGFDNNTIAAQFLGVREKSDAELVGETDFSVNVPEPQKPSKRQIIFLGTTRN